MESTEPFLTELGCTFNVPFSCNNFSLELVFYIILKGFSISFPILYITYMKINISIHRKELNSCTPLENVINNFGKKWWRVCTYNVCKNRKSYSIQTAIMQICYLDIINIEKIPLVLIPVTGTDNPIWLIH